MKELSFADVSRHFHLPLTQAAELLNVSVTLVKRICRENGVSRWPFRKLASRMKKERIAREDDARESSIYGHALPAIGSLVELEAEMPGVDDDDFADYLASLVDFVDSTETEPLERSQHDAAFGTMVDQTLEGAFMRGWNCVAGSIEQYGSLVDAIPQLDAVGLPARRQYASIEQFGRNLSDLPAGAAAGPVSPPGLRRDENTGSGSDAGSGGAKQAKRPRKGKEFSFADVSRHFHLPLTQAAELLNVSVTLVKRVCRENGVSRWPFRKLQARMRKEPIPRSEVPLHLPQAYPALKPQAVSASFWPGSSAAVLRADKPASGSNFLPAGELQPHQQPAAQAPMPQWLAPPAGGGVGFAYNPFMACFGTQAWPVHSRREGEVAQPQAWAVPR